MVTLLRRSFNDRSAHLRERIAGIYALLGIANAGVWIWASYVFRHQPVLLGTALLAYSFGLRHAVDADHIAAIDNVTRKLKPMLPPPFFAAVVVPSPWITEVSRRSAR
jgi:high-affinity nickel-transport protein